MPSCSSGTQRSLSYIVPHSGVVLGFRMSSPLWRKRYIVVVLSHGTSNESLSHLLFGHVFQFVREISILEKKGGKTFV